MAKGDQQVQQQSQSSKTTPWDPAQPALLDLINKYSSMNPSVTPGQSSALENLTGAASGLPNFGQSGTTAVNNLFNSSTTPQVGMLSDAYKTLQGNIGGTASGAELDPWSTPGFSDAIGTLSNDITNRVKGVYAGSGRDPSGAGSFAGSLGRGLTQGLAPVIQDQYNKNKTNQLGAANTLFGAGGATAGGITGQEQVPLQNAASALGLSPSAIQAFLNPATAQLGAANTAYQTPYGNIGALQQGITGIAGLGQQSSGTGTSTTTQPQSTLSNILGGTAGGIGLLSAIGGSGGAAGGASSLMSLLPMLALSDERTKTDIAKVGKLNDGQNVYSFKYIGSDRPQIGLLAQEVAEHVPDAVHNVGGLLMVDYGRASEQAREAA